jgi:hypothetical protein
MWVIPGRTLHFRKGTIEEHPISHENYFVQTDEFVLRPDPVKATTPVYAPDWIKDDDLYKLVSKEKNMLVETVNGPTPEDEEESATPKAKGAKPAGLTGWNKR